MFQRLGYKGEGNLISVLKVLEEYSIDSQLEQL